VISWELEQTLQIAFVLEAMQRALSQAVPQICKSDQGSHFTRPQYTQLLRSHDVRISMDSKGRALDNIFTERLWRSIKYEEVYVRTVQPKLTGMDEGMVDKEMNLDN
jgi:putative transposase